jgi:hypothetical protein
MSRNRHAFALLFAVLAQSAAARDTFHDYSVDAALKGPSAKNVRSIPVFMTGEDHPAASETLQTATSNRRTNAFGKSDEDACAIAFLSAIIALQDRATALGGSAVIDIKSITKHNDLVSATEYRCVSGALIANVALTGTIVKLASP